MLWEYYYRRRHHDSPKVDFCTLHPFPIHFLPIHLHPIRPSVLQTSSMSFIYFRYYPLIHRSRPIRSPQRVTTFKLSVPSRNCIFFGTPVVVRPIFSLFLLRQHPRSFACHFTNRTDNGLIFLLFSRKNKRCRRVSIVTLTCMTYRNYYFTYWPQR